MTDDELREWAKKVTSLGVGPDWSDYITWWYATNLGVSPEQIQKVMREEKVRREMVERLHGKG